MEQAFCVTFEVDITNFRDKMKEQEYFFTIARFMLYVDVQMR